MTRKSSTASAVLFGLALLGAGLPTAIACEPIQGVIKEPCECVPRIGFAGQCKKRFGEKDRKYALGRFSVGRPDKTWALDSISFIATVTPAGGGQPFVETATILASGQTCSQNPNTAKGCLYEFRLEGDKQCPNGGQNCPPSQKVTKVYTTLDQLNAALATEGDRATWVYYKVVCEDNGQFGDPGDSLLLNIRFTIEKAGFPATCVGVDARDVGKTEIIPESTMPCD